MIGVLDVREMQIGTSYANSGAVRPAVLLAIQIYREASILNAEEAAKRNPLKTVKRDIPRFR